MIEGRCSRLARQIGALRFVRPAKSIRLVLTSAAAASIALVATLLVTPRPVLLWNASPSSPLGLYLVSPRGRPRAGETIIAWAPPDARRLAALRHYLPSNVPLVKHVAAVSGDRVCAFGRTIFVNGRSSGIRRSRDLEGRKMPWWSGCRLLRQGELFLLVGNMPAAFDGRYFGVTRERDVIGQGRLLWAR